MSFSVGARLGTFELLGILGAGGMGEVYRARDTKLNRDVAIKVLPADMAQDHDRVARFRREAQLLASLNHPNIAAIYGLEESDGLVALALELVEGEDLSERLRQGAIPVPEALASAKQIAEALEAAHERGVVHRDLKPANVKVTPDGKVKVLDFGLAKAFSGEDATASGSHHVANSPTMSRHMTEAGVILGTAAYMSPEQARGKPVDKRADIWAFGVVLHEMLSGKQLFGGETVSDVLAAVLTREPAWTALPASTPRSVVRLLRRCLERDPRKRLRDIGEAVFVLAEPDADDPGPVPVLPAVRPWRERLAWGTAVVGVTAAAALWARGPYTVSTGEASGLMHVSVSFEPSETAPVSATISPDGLRVAFVGRVPGATTYSFFVRSLREAVARPLLGTEGADNDTTAAFSPDGRWLAFTQQNHTLKKIPVEGGPTTVLAEGNLRFTQLTWADNGMVLLTGFDPAHPGVIYAVPDSGGRPTPVAGAPGQADQVLGDPRALPGGRQLLVTVTGDHPALSIHSLVTGERRVLATDAAFGRLVGGKLVWTEANRLVAAPLDAAGLSLSGPTMVIQTDGIRAGAMPSMLDVSSTGSLLFRRAIDGTNNLSDAWFGRGLSLRGYGSGGLTLIDRSGKRTIVAGSDSRFSEPRLSPDGTRVVVSETSAANNPDVWSIDLRRGARSRISLAPGEDETGVWSPDGAWIAWASSRAGEPRGLFRRHSDGSGNEEKLWTLDARHFHAACWTPDGKSVLVTLDDPKTGWDVYVVTPGSPNTATALLGERFDENDARVSPDGRWIAYVSDESGRPEVYVQAFPGLGRKVQISVAGGVEPIWNPRGGEIVYRSGSSRDFMSVTVTAAEMLAASAPRVLVSDARISRGTPDHTNYDVARDGRLLAVEEPPSDPHAAMHLVLGWAHAAGLVR